MRPTEFIPDTETRTISIHAPRERCDILLGFHHIERSWNFNPRTAWAMRHILKGILCGFNPFQSTHRVSDATAPVIFPYVVFADFNPRTAWAMRPTSTWRCISSMKFQSTHRVSDATPLFLSPVMADEISIHAPRERCDRKEKWNDNEPDISIHAPRERCDGK